jgi:hypothetical protein
MMGAALGDRRSKRCLVQLCAQLAAQPQASFSAACGPAGRQAARRLFRRPDSNVHALLQGHVAQTAHRAAAYPCVLVAQDTTSFDFSHHPATAGLGPIDQRRTGHGLFGHAALALTPAGVPLGLLHVDLWCRDPAAHGQTHTRRHRVTATKESAKWSTALAAVEAAVPASPAGPMLLLLQDREGDVFDFLAAPRRPDTHLLIRAAQARKVRLPTEATPGGTLFERAAAGPIVGERCVAVPHGMGDERAARLVIRAQRLEIQRPRHALAAAARAPQWVWVVQACEETPPVGVAPLLWVLVSTLPVSGAADACQLVEYYALRWRIERLHYTLKSGLRAEDLQHHEAAMLQKAVALYYVVAWRLLALTYAARAEPALPAAAFLAADEVAVLTQLTGEPVPTVQAAVRAIGRLAGWQGYRGVPDPGVKMLWLGLRRLLDMTAGWRLARGEPPDPIQA